MAAQESPKENSNQLKLQWTACREEACLIPRCTRALIEVSGKDRGTFLQGLFSQDVAKNFPVGAVTYGIFPDLKGKIFADAYVMHVDNERFFLDVEKNALPAILNHLGKYLILLSAQLQDLSSSYERFSFIGPKSSEVFKKVEFPIPALNSCGSLPAQKGLIASGARRNFQEFQLWVKKQTSDKLQPDFKNACTLGSESVLEVIEIESGLPKLGRDMDETTFPQEVGLEEFVNFKKGCFIGAEVLQRIFYQGHVNRSLALFGCNELLSAGAKILHENSDVGKITSSVFSYRWKQPVALGIVKVSALEAGQLAAISAEGHSTNLQLLQAFAAVKRGS